MRNRRSLLSIVTAWLTFAAMSSSALPQDCCHPPSRRAERPAAPASTPAAPLSSLSAEELRKQFNASSQRVRIVALLSPTCPECQSGHAVVGGILKRFPSPGLEALLVWEPMRDGDSSGAAAGEAETVRDVRISEGWDGGRDIGKLFGKTLDLRQIAWDVYLIYKPGVTWEGRQPPHPTFWMHQLSGADPRLCLNPARLSTEVGRLLGQPD